jgi:membrane associated rhomboid family serine protease
VLPIRDELPTERFPWVNYALIIVNVLAYCGERLSPFVHVDGRAVAPDAIVRAYGLVPARLWAAPIDQASTIVTSMFLHDPTSVSHLAANMLFLWIFGDNVEDAIGGARYLVLYLGSGLLAALSQAAIAPGSFIPIVGASGAISGALAAYGVLYPRSPITVLNPVLPLWLVFGPFLVLPAWLIIAEYFMGNLIRGMLTVGSKEGGIAFFAHLGGFVGGWLLLLALRPIGLDPNYAQWSHWRRPPGRFRQSRER